MIIEKCIEASLNEKKFHTAEDCIKMIHPDKQNIVFESYLGHDVRMYTEGTSTIIQIPLDATPIQETNIAALISSGAIFDEITNVQGATDYVMKTTLPINRMGKHGLNDDDCCHLRNCVEKGIGVMNDDGHFHASKEDCVNGNNLIKELVKKHKKHKECHTDNGEKYGIKYNQGEDEDLLNTVKAYTDNDAKPIDLRKDIDKIDKASQDPEDEIDVSEYDEVDVSECGDEGNIVVPRKLKPIPDTFIDYVENFLANMHSDSDKKLISSLIAQKLNIVEFYLNCVDCGDGKYIVPHSRAELIRKQNQLQDALQRALDCSCNFNHDCWRANCCGNGY